LRGISSRQFFFNVFIFNVDNVMLFAFIYSTIFGL
jgi:hypothetical protein